MGSGSIFNISTGKTQGVSSSGEAQPADSKDKDKKAGRNAPMKQRMDEFKNSDNVSRVQGYMSHLRAKAARKHTGASKESGQSPGAAANTSGKTRLADKLSTGLKNLLHPKAGGANQKNVTIAGPAYSGEPNYIADLKARLESAQAALGAKLAEEPDVLAPASRQAFVANKSSMTLEEQRDHMETVISRADKHIGEYLDKLDMLRSQLGSHLRAEAKGVEGQPRSADAGASEFAVALMKQAGDILDESRGFALTFLNPAVPPVSSQPQQPATHSGPDRLLGATPGDESAPSQGYGRPPAVPEKSTLRKPFVPVSGTNDASDKSAPLKDYGPPPAVPEKSTRRNPLVPVSRTDDPSTAGAANGPGASTGVGTEATQPADGRPHSYIGVSEEFNADNSIARLTRSRIEEERESTSAKEEIDAAINELLALVGDGSVPGPDDASEKLLASGNSRVYSSTPSGSGFFAQDEIDSLRTRTDSIGTQIDRDDSSAASVTSSRTSQASSINGDGPAVGEAAVPPIPPRNEKRNTAGDGVAVGTTAPLNIVKSTGIA
jgi:hypothetical protein